MFGLPQSTDVRRSLPKAQLYKKFELKQSQRDAFDADIARMGIVNFIAHQTMPGIAEGAEVKAIFVMDVELKRLDYDPKNILLISKLIPYRMVFALRHEDNVQLAVYHSKLFTSPRHNVKDASIPLTGLNLDVVWQNIVSFVGSVNVAAGNTLTEQIRIDEERVNISRKIDSLERQMRSTSQPRRQRELYSEIKMLKSLL